MNTRLPYLLCALLLGLPAMAAARSSGTPHWGTPPQSGKTQFHGECCYNDPIGHGVQPGAKPKSVPKSGACNLAGVWKESPYTYATGEKRMTLLYTPKSTLFEYKIDESGWRGNLYELLTYDAKMHTVLIFSHAKTTNIMGYAEGTVSPDCHHISLVEHYSDFTTRKVQENFVRH